MESIWALAAKARAVSNINDRNAIVDFEIKPPIYRYYALPVKHFDSGNVPQESVPSLTIEIGEADGHFRSPPHNVCDR